VKSTVVEPGGVLEGRYELLRTWSSGGMASIWLARVRGAHGFEKFFAVKMPLPEFADDQGFASMFIDEARIIAQIRHGNVVGVEYVGDHEGIPYLVLEWVQGGSWMALIQACHKAKVVPADVMLRIAAGACAGLHAAHELRGESGEFLNVVHRDVSPQNVLVSETGTTKVIDFGIAKARGRMTEHTKSGMIKAKLEFASPEQLTRQVVDRRADVWGIGVTLYLIFVGKLPFDGEHPGQMIAAIGHGLTGPLPAHVPPPVAEVIQRALRVDPAERFQTLHEMRLAIERCITSPTTPETVSACLQEFLSGPLAARRKEIRLAIEEANRRAETAEPDVASERSHALPPRRARMPTLPPELVQREWDGKAVPSDAPPPSLAPPSPVVRMTPVAWATVVVSTLVALAVWSRVVVVALEIRAGGAQVTEPRRW
jgi:serine/threonine-protein kinase